MLAKDIRHRSESYNRAFDDNLHEIEQSLHNVFQEQEYVSQDQLRKVVEWKLDNQPGRRNRNIERINQVPDRFIRRVTEAALSVDDPKIQLKTLSSIPGIGYATATVILTFHDPEKYAICDRYMIDIFFDQDRQMRLTDYPKLLAELRDRNPGGFNLRTVEKAYYQRYRVQEGIA